ncbi:hypothetical protein M0R45_000680 [Rubus argutus]|uniref:Mechanosensitive ion channel protein n=1 Tax=Rubus argutus TaxID=59490 RepID=A0AAW1VK38_RUBAR
MSEKQPVNGGQVVLEVGREEITDANGSSEALDPPQQRNEALLVSSESVPIGSVSPEISRFSPKNESINRSVLSKRKSTSGVNSPYWASFNSLSDKSAARTASFLDRAEEMEEDEEVYLAWIIRWVVNNKVFVDWIVFLCLVGVLVASFTVDKLENLTVWDLKFWKWCVLAMVIFRGMLFTNWFMQFIVFVTRSNFWLRNKMLYYVHGMKKSVQVFMWLVLVLLTWLLLCDRGIERSKASTKIFHYVTWSLVSVLIGAFLWLLKTLSFKILALRFYLHTFVDRTRESIFHQFVLQTLSGPPFMEKVGNFGQSPSFRKTKKAKGGEEKNVIDMGQLLKLKLEEVSARTMEEIASELEATAAAYHIFHNVAKPGSKYIEEEDLMRFLIKEEVDLAFMLIEGAETGRINRQALTDWVVKVYNARKGLIHSLTDTKKAVKQLDKLVTSILIVIGIVVWLLLVEIATTKVLVFLSSQIVLAAFIFGNTCKNIFEAVVFVFVMHPFHVGDRCVVDGVPLIVEEMNILTTVFSKLNKDKVYYPNSVLSTLPISNCKENSDTGDFVEFSIAFAPVDKIYILKEKIKRYFEANPQYWHPNHNVAVIGIENGNTLKMALYFDYILKPQIFGVDQKEFGEKTKRRSELVIELMKIMEELNITCSVLPPQSSSNLS